MRTFRFKRDTSGDSLFEALEMRVLMSALGQFVLQPGMGPFGPVSLHATADVSGGNLPQGAGITATSPGTGYTSVPTITLIGGLPSGNSTALADSTSSAPTGLTKYGAGTLTMTASSWIPGTIAITAGILMWQGASSCVGPVVGAGGTEIAEGATLTTSSVNINSLAVAGTLIIQSSPVVEASTVSQLSVAGSAGAWTGKIDIGYNALIVRSKDPYAQAEVMSSLTDQIESGRAGGLWNGTGITSSLLTMPAGAGYSLGIADAGMLGLTSFQGQLVDENSTIVVIVHNTEDRLDASEVARLRSQTPIASDDPKVFYVPALGIGRVGGIMGPKLG